MTTPDEGCRNCSSHEKTRRTSTILCADCFHAFGCLDCKSTAEEPSGEWSDSYLLTELCSEDLKSLPVKWSDEERAQQMLAPEEVVEPWDLELRCSVCGGELQELGILGSLQHLRCRDCGSDHSSPVVSS